MTTRALRTVGAVAAVTLFVAVTFGSGGRPGLVAAASTSPSDQSMDWPVNGGQKSGGNFSPLTQINRSNVKQLKVAWSFPIGDAGGLQTTPLVVDRTMFVYSPDQKVTALAAATGKVLWEFDPGIASGQPDRGFSYWSDGQQKVLFANNLYNIWALDPSTGKPIVSFGDGGKIDLRRDLGDDQPKVELAATTPGQVFKDMLIIGFRTAEARPAIRGDIRAYDVHTGKLRWSFHTIPHPGEAGYETWPADAWKTSGAANNWAGMVLDEKRGILYAPTGSAASDFYGADRAGNDLYANTLLALDANTGKRLWHFQAVHHDLWDRDFPSPPVLVTVKHDGKFVDAVAQPTKNGVLYLFDRVTGKALFPIEERPVPSSDTPGEWTSKTQPWPTLPKPYARQRLTAELLTDRTPEAHAWAVEQFRTFRSEGQFVPMSVDKPTVVFPGYDGGAEWGGPGLDPATGVIYINSNDVAWTGSLTLAKKGGPAFTAYQNRCAACHGPDRAGSPPSFPSLIAASKNLTAGQMTDVIHSGRGRMPAFPDLNGEKLETLLNYVRTGMELTAESGGRSDKQELGDDSSSQDKYRFTGYKKFLDPEGYPAIVPPWGTLNAIDLNTGKYLWKIPLGEYPALVAQGKPITGSENYGGPIVTAGGLVIIASTIYDHKIRAFDSKTGHLLWEYVMPFAGNATPATYMIDGKQYIAIAVSNARDRTAKQGAAYIAFALP